MKVSILFMAGVLLFAGCSKMKEAIIDKGTSNTNQGEFTKYTIRQGQNYSQGNNYKPLELTEMKFAVKFDSTAIYQTGSAENQYDINKLFGFSDNNTDHHQFSARFGWRWSENALRLFGYVYNEGAMTSKELTTIAIGAETICSIKITGTHYLFYVNDAVYQLPRLSTTEKAKGYQLYPYFGGDEVAPHDVNIWIKEM